MPMTRMSGIRSMMINRSLRPMTAVYLSLGVSRAAVKRRTDLTTFCRGDDTVTPATLVVGDTRLPLHCLRPLSVWHDRCDHGRACRSYVWNADSQVRHDGLRCAVVATMTRRLVLRVVLDAEGDADEIEL